MPSVHGPASLRPEVALRWLWRGSRARIRPYLERWTPDSIVLARHFRQTFGRPINWRQPVTFNEKLFWLIRYARDPIMPRLADKVAVRDFVSERGAGTHLTACYGVWDHVAEVPWDRLPPAFVLKVAWGSGMNVFCRDRGTFDLAGARARLTAWTQINHYWKYREWAYKPIRPRILAEELLLDDRGQIPEDYKFFCFGGIPRLIQVDRGRFTQHTRDCYTPTWEPVPVRYHYPRSGEALPRPAALDAMCALARRLSAGFPFVRVDLYGLGARVVFGEMTWYPEAGLGRFDPPDYDAVLGDWLSLPGGGATRGSG